MRHTIKAITSVTSTPAYAPEAVKALMKYLRMNEKSFALFMNVTPITVRFWTTGAAEPCGLAKRLMQIYELFPEALSRLVEDGDDR